MSNTARDDACYLVADIGGTNARFAWVPLVDPQSDVLCSAPLRCVHSYRCADFVRIEDAIAAYLARICGEHAPKPVSVCLAVAASVHHDRITLTNHPWSFSRDALQKWLGIPVRVLNDFSAQALCLPLLGEEDVQWWQHQAPDATVSPRTFARTIIGPGTGFGAATLTATGEVLESEPGHVSFAPVNVHESTLLRELWRRYPRVSVEHLLSGPGLANLYWAHAQLHSSSTELDAAAIVDAAHQGDELALRTVQDFTAILGSVCGDIALSMGSLGGFYLSGGMLEKMAQLFDQNLFLARFTAKGPFSSWCSEVPVGRVRISYPGLLGCAAHARASSS